MKHSIKSLVAGALCHDFKGDDTLPSSDFDLLSYYKGLYEKEMEFSERLNSKISNAITLLTIIGSGLVLLIAEIFPIVCPLNIYSVITLILCVVSGAEFAIALFKFRLTYSGFIYDYFPIVGMEDTIQFAIKRGMREGERREINKRLIALYREGAIANRKSNLTKSKRQLELNGVIVIAFCVLMVTFVAWFVFLKYRVPIPPPIE